MPPPSCRILHVTNMYPTKARPGLGAFVAGQVQALGAIGVRQDVLIIPEGGPLARYLRGARLVRDRVSRGDVDVVHAHYGVVGFCALGLSVPMVVTCVGSDLQGQVLGGLLKRLQGQAEVVLSQIAGARAQQLIVMSRRMRELVWSVAARESCMVLPYGIDTQMFRPGDRSASRRRFGLNEQDIVVLWPHSESALKRKDLAEAAIAQVRRYLPRIRLWKPPPVAGDVMPACYHAADCLLVTSVSEGSPTVVKEALSTALPVVSVDVGDVWDWIGGLSWCRRVEPNAEQIAVGIRGVVGAPRPTNAPGIVREFDARTVAVQLVEVYERVAQSRQPGRTG